MIIWTQEKGIERSVWECLIGPCLHYPQISCTRQWLNSNCTLNHLESLQPRSSTQKYCCNLLGCGPSGKVFQSSPGDDYVHLTENHLLVILILKFSFLGLLMTSLLGKFWESLITKDISQNTWSKERSALLMFTRKIKFPLTGGNILVYQIHGAFVRRKTRVDI